MPKKSGESRPRSLSAPGDGAALNQDVAALERSVARVSAAGQGSQPYARPGSSFEARFGRIILQHGVAAIPSALLHFQGRLKLSSQQVWFVSYVLSHKWDDDLPYPSLKKMERNTGICERHLRRIKGALCVRGLLAVYPRYGEQGRRDTDSYDFAGLFGRLEKLIVADAPLPNAIRSEEVPPAGPADLVGLDPSFIARYGRVIARRGIAAVPRAIFTHQAALGLTPQHVWFISYIFSFQWDTSLPYPSIRRMATTTGYSSVQLHNIKGELVEKDYLRLVRRRDEQGGQDTNAYDFSGLLEAIRDCLKAETPAPEVKQPTQQPEEDEPPPRRGRKASSVATGAVPREAHVGDQELAGVGDRHLPAQGDFYFTGAGDQELSAPGDRYLSGGGDSQLSTPGKRESSGRVTRVLRGGGTPALHEIESVQAEEDKDDSKRIARKNKVIGEPTVGPIQKYSPYIAALASDFSHELGDALHEASNMKQALNLWNESRLGENEFARLMQEARKRTRKYQARPTWDALHNRMAYFFATLRDLCEEKGGA